MKQNALSKIRQSVTKKIDELIFKLSKKILNYSLCIPVRRKCGYNIIKKLESNGNGVVKDINVYKINKLANIVYSSSDNHSNAVNITDISILSSIAILQNPNMPIESLTDTVNTVMIDYCSYIEIVRLLLKIAVKTSVLIFTVIVMLHIPGADSSDTRTIYSIVSILLIYLYLSIE